MGMAAEPQFHVLAVDDSSLDRKLIERLLKTSSYQVTTVDSGTKALEFLGLQEYDKQSQNQPSVFPDSQQEVDVNLIITDYCMPGMTGYDLLKKVKESTVFRNIPVVIMSSENVPSRITRCLEEGAEEFFLKPVRLSDVNRLKPHMLRAKYGQQRQDLLHECQKPEPKPERRQQQCEQKQPETKSEKWQQQCEHQPETKPEQWQQPCEQPPEPIQQQQQYEQQVLDLEHQTEQQQQNNNKRKSIDEGLSPDRTRPRLNGISTVV